MKRIYLIVVYIVLIPFSTAFAAYTNNEAFSKMLKLKEQGKIPAYVVERGTYKYVQDNSVAYVNGKNVFMRSQPQKGARVITKLSNTELEYLGEWTHPKNEEKWICVREKESNEIGWIYGKYIKLLKATSTKSTKIQTKSKEDKKDKTCTEDPCGALGGLLLVSPILYFFSWIDEHRGTNTQETVDIIDIISPYYKHYSKWETFGPDEAFYEVMRTAPLLDVLEVLKHIDFNQTDSLYWLLQIDKAAFKNPHMFVYSEVSNFISQFLTS